jgi:hypothetical protein
MKDASELLCGEESGSVYSKPPSLKAYTMDSREVEDAKVCERERERKRKEMI